MDPKDQWRDGCKVHERSHQINDPRSQGNSQARASYHELHNWFRVDVRVQYRHLVSRCIWECSCSAKLSPNRILWSYVWLGDASELFRPVSLYWIRSRHVSANAIHSWVQRLGVSYLRTRPARERLSRPHAWLTNTKDWYIRWIRAMDLPPRQQDPCGEGNLNLAGRSRLRTVYLLTGISWDRLGYEI